ncbi:MAG TPA: tol-pal system protein YbgF [Rhizomicrobium sp.]|jgi:tol-pal system protein YbgF|nr:tol-pal system protein YbgF [Rhizomicrobium sp.]
MRTLLSRAAAPAVALCLMAAQAAADPQTDLQARLDAATVQAQALRDRIVDDSAKLGNRLEVAALFGESDAEKAAREQHEQNQDQGIAALNARASDLENSLRNLTGQVEQLDHRIAVMNDRMERMQKDFDYKLCTMAAQQLGASSGDNALPCNGSQVAGSVAAAPPANVAPAPQNFPPSGAAASGPPQHLAPGPGVLGTIPSNTPLPLPPAAGAQQGDMPPPVAHPEFDKAMNLLAKAQYDQAAAAFRGYVDAHPNDPLAPQALYWVGDIQYVQKDYAGATHSFAEGLKKYPTSARAPDSMLKFAESLIALDQKKEGCAALAAFASKYPNATKPVAARAAAERKAVCVR